MKQFLLVLIITILLLVGCGGDSDDPTPIDNPIIPSPSVDLSSVPLYADPGPYPVGVTTLDLGDRLIEVWYPGKSGSEKDVARASYTSFDMMPDAFRGFLPEELNMVYEMPAYRDIPVSENAPFPVLTFSHGASGYRLANSNLLAGIATHGFIVASIDHIEWGMMAMTGSESSPDRDVGEVVLDTLNLIETENTTDGSFFEGWADISMVASAGHSMGGLAAFALSEGPEIDAMIGYAAVISADLSSSDKPILFIAGAEDKFAISNQDAYETMSPVKRYVSVARAGHNSFTDSCNSLHSGEDFLQNLVDSGFPIPENLIALAYEGCRPENLDPREFWRVVQHFTVAHMRQAFGLNGESIGLGPGVADAFEGIEMVYRSQE